MPGGFSAPSILFLNSWNKVERDFMQQAVTRLRSHGSFRRCVEPCAGGFAMSGVFREAGFPSEALEASDVNLFTAIVGFTLADQDHAALGVRIDGEPVELTGHPVHDGALLLYVQLLARLEAKPPVHYWQEIVIDLKARASAHVEGLAYYLDQLRKRFTPGLTYTIEAPWDHMRRAADDEQAIILVNPPSYAGAYERFFDTRGRLAWDAEPEYEVWEPKRDLPKLVEESEGWEAVILCLHLAPHGECVHADPVYAHDKRRGANDYIWSNKPDLIRAAMGGSVSRVRTLPDHEKLENPIIPRDYEITPESEVSVQKLSSKQARYYCDLWVHRLDFGHAASCELVVFVDGFVAGIAGFASIPLADDQLSMHYAVGAHHNEYRLTRLVKTLALTRPVLEIAMNPWFVVTASRIVTKNWTKHPEAKGQRGLMKLIDRKTHDQHGYELTYAAPVADRTIREAFELWFEKEMQWREKTTRRQAGVAA